MEMRCMQTPNASVMRKIAIGETTGGEGGEGPKAGDLEASRGSQYFPARINCSTTQESLASHMREINSPCSHAHTCAHATCARPSPARVRVCVALPSYPVSCSTVKKEKKRLLLALELEPLTLPGNRDSNYSST
jgi:hypothetical protein